MINQNELRIGNLVMGKHLSVRNTIEVYKIARVNWNGSIMVENRIGRFEEDMEDDITPIPITEEWLMKAGFVKDGEGDYCKGDFCFRWQFNALTLLLDTGHIKPPLIHLHQLQNLYFALTGQELNIEI